MDTPQSIIGSPRYLRVSMPQSAIAEACEDFIDIFVVVEEAKMAEKMNLVTVTKLFENKTGSAGGRGSVKLKV